MNDTSTAQPTLHLPPLVEPTLQAIWQNEAYQFSPELTWTKYPPLYPTTVRQGGILVLGINPSLAPEHLHRLTYDAPQIEGADYFGRLTKFMNRVIVQHQRFREASGAAHEVPVVWSHLDVLYVRETNQQLFRQELGRPGVAGFLYEQLLLTKDLLERVAPRLVLVANTFAAELLGKNVSLDKQHGVWMGLEFTSEINLHTGTWHCPSLPGSPPVFFTGSLAGSNPRNKEDDARLAWQLARCLWLQENQ